MKASLAHMKSADRKSNIALVISIIALIVAIIELNTIKPMKKVYIKNKIGSVAYTGPYYILPIK